MSFLLDTNVLSEPTKRSPDARLMSWLNGLDEDQAFVSIVSIAEIRRGLERLPAGRRRERLLLWLEELADRFAGRILSIDRPVAEAWGVVMADVEKEGFTLSVMDGFLAATAKVYGVTLVTRNVKDFERLRIEILNPWSV